MNKERLTWGCLLLVAFVILLIDHPLGALCFIYVVVCMISGEMEKNKDNNERE